MRPRTQRRIMVIGGASLVGSHLCERLLLAGDEVIAVDDFTSGSFATVAHLKREARFSFVEHDVTRQLTARKLDAVFHLAVPSSRRAYESDPVRSTVTSVVGTAHALELAADHDARLVLATSPERYGQGIRCAESLVVDFMKSRKVDARLVRVATTYGPRMPADDPHVLMGLVLQAIRGEELTLAGDGSSVHRLTYVGDAVDTLVRTLDADLRVPAVAAPHVDATTTEIARAVAEATSRTDVVFASAPAASTPPGPVSLPFSMRPTTPEALSACIVFGQRPALDLRVGIERTVRWFESRYAALVANQPRTSGIFGINAPSPSVSRAKIA